MRRCTSEEAFPLPRGCCVVLLHTCSSSNALASLSAHSYAPGTLSPYALASTKGFFKNKNLRYTKTESDNLRYVITNLVHRMFVTAGSQASHLYHCSRPCESQILHSKLKIKNNITNMLRSKIVLRCHTTPKSYSSTASPSSPFGSL